MEKKSTNFLAFLKKKIPKIDKKMRQGCDEEVIKILESKIGFDFPESYKIILRKYNGEGETVMIMAGFALIGIEEANSSYEWIKNNITDDPNTQDEYYAEVFRHELNMVKPHRYGLDRFPFAHDGSGQYLCFDFDPAENGKKGQIIYLACGEDEPISVLFNDFDEFLKFIIDSVNSDRLLWEGVNSHATYNTWRDDWTDIAAEFKPNTEPLPVEKSIDGHSEKKKILKRLYKHSGCNTVWNNVKGEPAKTKIFHDSNLTESKLVLSDNELPIFELFFDKNDFVLFTTNALYIQTVEKLVRFAKKDWGVDILGDDTLFIKEINKYENKKKEFLDIKIYPHNQEEMILKIEQGTPFEVFFLLVEDIL